MLQFKKKLENVNFVSTQGLSLIESIISSASLLFLKIKRDGQKKNYYGKVDYLTGINTL